MGEHQIGSTHFEQGQSTLREIPDRVRLPLRFDPVPLQEDLARLSSAGWTPHFIQQNYDGEWSALPLRAPAGATHPIQQIAANPGIQAWQPTGWLNRSRHLQEVLGHFRCPIGSVRLMRLTSGSAIREHRDNGLAAECGSARLHIPICTQDGVEFLLNGSPVPMAAGELWYLRLSDPHRAVNRSGVDRIHLVIDIEVNRWFEALLREGMKIG